MLLAALLLACAAVATLVYGWFEAGWLRSRVLEVAVHGLPEPLEGLRIAHLSDFHLGAPLSRGNRASALAVDWVAARRPDLVCVTGDLVSHPRGEPHLRELLRRLDRPLVVLGNHDVAVTRDPFSRAAELRDLEQSRSCGMRPRRSRFVRSASPWSASTPSRTARHALGHTSWSTATPASGCFSATFPPSSTGCRGAHST